MDEYNVVVTGVGGQGVLFTSQVLGEAAVREGFDTKVAEIHGMAQRGGAVTCDVRIGRNIYSPTIMERTADMVIGLEPLEVLRALEYVHEGTTIVLNKAPVVPSSASLSDVKYPSMDAILIELSRISKNILAINARDIAMIAGNPAAQNVVMIGFISELGKLPMKSETLRKTIGDRNSLKYRDVNLKAFDLGVEECKRMVC